MSWGVATNLRHKQHAVGGQRAEEDGSGHGAADQVGPGLQEDGHGDDHGAGEGDQGDGRQDGGRLVDRRVADVAGQSGQIRAVEEQAALQTEAGNQFSVRYGTIY